MDSISILRLTPYPIQTLRGLCLDHKQKNPTQSQYLRFQSCQPPSIQNTDRSSPYQTPPTVYFSIPTSPFYPPMNITTSQVSPQQQQQQPQQPNPEPPMTTVLVEPQANNPDGGCPQYHCVYKSRKYKTGLEEVEYSQIIPRICLS
ncbi:unnamed protein product [Allacma fusca]|uniref:Uncharacterized protein n=1 Tax=Allacma fusca TaxID=39272 RepID=A0A8J2NVB3_9HEXA|nr:unnamed protein product [Allacma fusca]